MLSFDFSYILNVTTNDQRPPYTCGLEQEMRVENDKEFLLTCTLYIIYITEKPF